MDLDTEKIKEENGFMVVDDNIFFTSDQLELNRHYNIMITASNIVGSSTSYAQISKN